MSHQLRLALKAELPIIMEIIDQAKARRKAEGSNQWQDGYPNMASLEADIDKKCGYVLAIDNKIVGYCAALVNDEPAYKDLEGHWLTTGDFIVIHRVAIHDDFLGKGFAIKIFDAIEKLAISKGIFSIKVDTNFDNLPMLHIFEKLGYQYCGQVYFRGSARRAYEKILNEMK